MKKPGTHESMAEYIVELCRLALQCEFGKFLKSALRDRLVCGFQGASLKKQLLAQTDLTGNKALQVAQGMEAAKKNMKTLQDGDSGSSNAINSTGPSHEQSRKSTKSCYCCGTPITLLVIADFEIQCVKKGILQKFVRVDERTAINSKQTRNSLNQYLPMKCVRRS